MYNIIIPTYRRKESLILLLNQLNLFKGYFNRILVIAQDGIFETHFTNVDVFNFNWANVSTARNYGNMLSNCEWNLFIDDDVFVDANFFYQLNNKVEEAMRTENRNSIFAPIVVDLGMEIAEVKQKYIDAFGYKEQPNSNVEHLPSTAFLINKTSYNLIGGFDVELFNIYRTSEDFDFFQRCVFNGINLTIDFNWVLYHDDKKAGGCSLRELSTKEKYRRHIGSYIYIYKKHNKIQKNHFIKSTKKLIGFLVFWIKMSGFNFRKQTILFNEILRNFVKSH